MKTLTLHTRNFNNTFPSNLHTHTPYCDGRNSIPEFVETAISKGFISLGFSGHSYLSFAGDYAMAEEGTLNYIADLQKYKNDYKNSIDLYIGIEADYYSHITKEQAKGLGLDYTLGSVHYIANADNSKFYGIDYVIGEFKDGVANVADGNIQKFVRMYYDLIIQMVNEQTPDIIGHIDLIKKLNHNNCFFDENDVWYKKLVTKAIQHISTTNCIVEVNTGGMARGYTSFPYPSQFMLETMLAYDVPITICSDSHQISTLDYHFEETVKVLRTIGFNTVKIMHQGSFHDFIV